MQMFWGAQTNHRGGKHLYTPFITRSGSTVYLSLCGKSKMTLEPVRGFQGCTCPKCSELSRALEIHPDMLRDERRRMIAEQANLAEKQRRLDALINAHTFEMAQG